MGRAYSPPDNAGISTIFQVRVLTGEFTRGQHEMRAPPPKDPNIPEILFDSVCDNLTNPSMFIVLADTNAYPEYIVKFRRN